MIERDDVETSSNVDNFLLLDSTIFEIPEPNETLAKVIDTFHKVTQELDMTAHIRKEAKDNPYYKYKFQHSFELDLKISIFTPIPSETTDIDMNSKNTKAVFKWTSSPNMYTELKPLEKEDDKGEYLGVLQLIVAQRVVENEQRV